MNGTALFQPGIPINTHACQQSDLITSESWGTPALPSGQPNLFGRDACPARPQKITEFLTAFRVRELFEHSSITSYKGRSVTPRISTRLASETLSLYLFFEPEMAQPN